MKIFRLLAIVGLVIIIFSCNQQETTERIKEGYIDYDIDYIDDTLQNMMFKFLPKKMTVKFKDNNTLNKIESISGIIFFAVFLAAFCAYFFERSAFFAISKRFSFVSVEI